MIIAALLCMVLVPPTTPPAAAAPLPAPPTMREVFPHVRADVAAKVVEFDAMISPALIDDPAAPLVYLEIVACAPDTREHESILVSKAKPSHVHAALLLIGLAPGAPGSWKFENDALTPVPPTGHRLAVRFCFSDASGKAVEADPQEWIVNQADGRTLAAAQPAEGWLFAGSRLVKPRAPVAPAADPQTAPPPPAVPAEVYDADGTGTLLGLHTFGSESIAWSSMMNPDAGVEAPQWTAKLDAIPDPGTKVRVRLTPAAGHAPAGPTRSPAAEPTAR